MLGEIINYTIQADASGALKAIGATKTAMAETAAAGAAAATAGDAAQATVAARLQAAGSKMMGFGLKMTAGVTLPAVAAFMALGRSAAEAARAHELLAANLRNSAGATDEQVDASEGFLKQIALTTGVVKGQTRPALSQLAAATGDVGKAQDLLSVALDVSTARGKPLEAVTMALSRAYNGSTAGLSRLGVATKDANGNALSFDAILQNLRTTTEGTAEAMGKTAAGQASIMAAKLGMLKADISAKLLPAFNGLIEKITGVIEWFSRLPAGVQQAGLAILGLAAAVGPITTVFGGLLKTGGKAIEWGTSVATAMREAGGAIEFMKAKGMALLANAPWLAAAVGLSLVVGLFMKARNEVAASWDKMKEGADSFTERVNVQRQAATDLKHAMNDLPPIADFWIGESAKADQANREMFEANQRYFSSIMKIKEATGLTAPEIEKLAKANGVDLADGSGKATARLIDLAVGTGKAKDGIKSTGTAAGETADDMEALKQQLDDLLGGFLGAEQADARYTVAVEETRKKLGELNQAHEDMPQVMAQARTAISGLVGDWRSDYEAMAKNGASAEELARKKDSLTVTLGQLRQQFPALAPVIDDYTRRMQAIPGSKSTTITIDAPGADAVLERISTLAGHLSKSATGAGLLGEKITHMGAAAGKSVQDVDRLSDSLNRLLNPFLSSQQAATQYEKALLDVDKKIKEVNADHQVTNEELLDTRSSVQSLVSDWQRNYDAMGKNHASAEQLAQSKQKMIEKLAVLREQVPALAGEVDGYANIIRSVPTRIDTTANFEGDPEIYKYASAMDRIGQGVSNAVGSAVSKAVGHHATGGTISAGSWSWVGEEGPELIRVPATATVRSAPESRAMAATSTGSTTSIVVNVGNVLGDAETAVSAIEEGLARRLRRSGSLAFL